MPLYLTSLLSRESVANNTLAVSFARPADFTFHAGQYADIALVSSPFHDLWGNLRTFSMASAPFQDNLEFVMRLSNTAFKRALSVVPTGTMIEVKGAAGSFNLHADDARPAVFLAGGVGIAPFLSMLRQAEHDGLLHQFYLFYSNRELGDTAYLNELCRQATQSPLKLDLVPTITGVVDVGWTGEIGRIDPAMLLRHIGAGTNPMYYIAGPSQFVSRMISVLAAIDASEADVQVEDFGEF